MLQFEKVKNPTYSQKLLNIISGSTIFPALLAGLALRLNTTSNQAMEQWG